MSSLPSSPSPRPARAAARLAAALAFTWAPVGVLVLAPCAAQAQQPAAQGTGRITGVVADSAGAPVPNVQVTVPGTRAGGVSGTDGRYTITGVPAGSYQLRTQRIGYAPVTQPVTVADGQTVTADFRVAAAAVTLNQVVTVGYTNEQRRDISGAVTSVAAEDLREQQVATVEEALRGRVPGVQIAASGEPGRPAQVVIRGQNGLGNPSPLYVVDGMYLSQNPNVNPADVESIEVLKDASAAAQYGAQASNGVIVIRTRRGRTGENRIDLRTYYGYQEVPKRIEMMNTTQWQALNQAAYAAAGQTPPAGVTAPSQVSTDWQDAVFRGGAIQDHNLTASGGTAAASYLLSGGVTDQRGSLVQTSFRRYNVRVNSEARRSRLTLGENIALSRSNRQGLVGYPLIDVVRMLPTIAVRDPANPGGWGYGNDANPTFGTNPVGALNATTNRNHSNQVIGTAYADVALPANFRYRFNLGLNYNDFDESAFNSIAQLRYRTAPVAATLNENRDEYTSLLYENLLTYDNSFRGDTHRLNAVAGVTSQEIDFGRINAYRQGYSDESLRTINAGLTQGLNNAGTDTTTGVNSYLVRATYAFSDRYLVTASGRRDCSSRFSPDNRCGNFGAASLGWVASEEGFFKSIPFVGGADFLKIRASTGVLGDQNIGNYQFVAPVAANRNYILGGGVVQGASQVRLANPDIRWQQNRSNDVGIDMELLGNVLSITADYYRNTTSGLLVAAPLPLSLGADTNPVVNAGSFRNTGFEFGATHRLTRGDFGFNTTLNFTTQRNRVVRLGNGNQPIFAGFSGVSRTAVGEAVGQFFVKRVAGIFQDAAEVASYTAANGKAIQPNAQPGDIRYDDINGDGIINDGDRYNAGSGIPKYNGFLGLDARYRDLDVGLNVRGSGGNKIFNVVKYWTERMDDIQNSRAGLEPWTPQNRSTTTPRAVFGPAGAQNADPVSDRWIESGNFLRVQNVIVGYRLPATLLRQFGSGDSRPRVYLNAQNLFTISNYSGWDPDVTGLNDPLARGIDDGFIYPNVRTITLGLDLRL